MLSLDRLKLEVRPVGVFSLQEPLPPIDDEVGPLLGWGSSKSKAVMKAFEDLAKKLAYGSAVVFTDLDEEATAAVMKIAATADFREWLQGPDYPGLPANSRTWVKSHYDGQTYATHIPHLMEAVKRTTGPVLELGSGDGSTTVLHDVCAGRALITVDSNKDWLKRFEDLKTETHRFIYVKDPGRFLLSEFRLLPELQDFELKLPWGVVFVDHSPGETRRHAIETARMHKAVYIVVHDTEELGYGVEDILASFKYRKDFRYARPWTSVVSDTHEIW